MFYKEIEKKGNGASSQMDCKEGYYGNYCDEPCPPGSFGVECGGRCFPKCTKEDCHHISGCPNYIENTTIQFGDEQKRQRISSSNTTPISIKTSAAFITEKPAAEIKINLNSLLAVGGVFLSLFLFVIILQLYTCKRSTTARIKTFKRTTCETIGKSDEFKDTIQHEIGHPSNKMPSPRNKPNVNQAPKCDYHEIGDMIEIRHTSHFSNESQKYETPRVFLNSRHSYSPLTVENSYLSPLFQGNVVETHDVHCNETNTDLYLEPINVIENANVGKC